MCSWKCCDELHRVWWEASNDAVCTADKNKVLTDHQTIGTLGLKKRKKLLRWAITEYVNNVFIRYDTVHKGFLA